MFSIVEYLSDYVQIEVMNNDNVTFLCPYCGRGERHFNVSVKKDRPVYYCYSCRKGGNWTKLIGDVAHIHYKKAHKIVNGFLDYQYQEEKNEEVKINFPPNSGWTISALEYLESRRINKQEAESYGWYYCNNGKYQKRLILPIYVDTKAKTFQARTVLSDVDPRYRSPYKSPIRNLLYNIDNYKVGDRLILTEGIFDAINVAKTGRSVVATFGKDFSDGQINLMKEKGVKKVCLMYDPDTVDKIPKMWEKLSYSFSVSAVVLTDKDPADILNISELDTIMDTMIHSISELEDMRLEKIFKGE